VGYELILAGLPPDAARAFESGLKQHPRSIKLLIVLEQRSSYKGTRQRRYSFSYRPRI